MTAGLVAYVLLAWMCPSSCQWVMIGQFSTREACNTVKDGLARYAECVEMKVPAPGSPR